MTVRDWIKTNFTSSISNIGWSFGETLNMENPGGSPYLAGIEVYNDPNLSSDYSLEIIVRLIMRDAPANDPVKGDILTLINDMVETTRKSEGRIPVKDYAAVDQPGETPVTLASSLVVMNSEGDWGKPWKVFPVMKDSAFWTCNLIYRFRLVEQMAGADNL